MALLGDRAAFAPRARSGAHSARSGAGLAAEVKVGPDAEPVVVSTETLLRWFRDYQTSGLAALERQPRQDRGKPRALDAQTMAILLDLAADHPRWTVKAVVRFAKPRSFWARRSRSNPSTYRFLKDRRSKPAQPPAATTSRGIARSECRRCCGSPTRGMDRTYSGRIASSARATSSIAILDDASRAVMGGQFFLRDDVASLLVVLRQAILARGLPHRPHDRG